MRPWRFFSFLLLGTVFLLGAAPVRGLQGCSLCKDTTAGSSPRAQAALRKAILVLGVPAGVVFVGLFALAWRYGSGDGGDYEAEDAPPPTK